MAAVLDGQRPRLRTFRDEAGREHRGRVVTKNLRVRATEDGRSPEVRIDGAT